MTKLKPIDSAAPPIKPERSLGRSSLVVGGATLVSRVLGFVRDVVLARWLGATASMDVFIVALQIPNFFRRLFAEGAFNQAFVPVLAEYRNQHKRSEVRQFVGRITGTLGLFLLGFVLLGMLLAPLFIYVFSSGFADQPEQFALAVNTLRITFPYLLFIALTACAASVLNTYGQFFAPAIAPVILNVCIIAAALWALSHQLTSIAIIAFAVTLAGALQWLLQWPFLHWQGMLAWPRFAWHDPYIKKIRCLMLPALFAVSATQINLIVDRHIASYLQEGSISWLFYADRLMEFPLGIYVIAIATVLLPSLSKSAALNCTQQFAETLAWGLKITWLIALPAAAGLFLLAQPILSTLFEAGKFGARDVLMAGLSLQAYAFALLGLAGIKVLAPAYFAKQDMKTPVRASVLAVGVNVVLNLVFVWVLVANNFHAPHVGLAVAGSIATWVNAYWLWHHLNLPQIKLNYVLLAKSLLACALMTAVLFYYQAWLGDWASLSGLARWQHLFGLVGAGFISYLAGLALLREPCWRWFNRS